MKYSQIAETGMSVSALCLGTMTFGSPVGAEDAVRLIHHARAAGINFVDTANMYEGYARRAGSSGGVAEEIVGEAIRGARDEYILATKLGMKVGDEPDDEFTSPSAIRTQLRKSLKRLGTDYVDLYYLHRPDPNVDAREICAALADELAAGTIRGYGVSNFNASDLRALVDAAHELGVQGPVVCQPKMNLLNLGAMDELVPLCVDEGISVVPYQALEGGVLTGKYRRGSLAPTGSRAAEMPGWVIELSDPVLDRLDEIAAAAEGEGLSMTDYALQSMLDLPGVVSALIGVKREEQIDDVVKRYTRAEATA